MENSGSTNSQPTATRIDEKVARLGDWRGETLRRMRTLIEAWIAA